MLNEESYELGGLVYLPVCPRCNHRHLMPKMIPAEDWQKKNDYCPYCNCSLKWNVMIGWYE